MRNKFCAVLICIIMACMLLAGCGKDKNAATIDKNTIYKEEPLNITFEEGFQVNQAVAKNGQVFFSGYKYDEKNYTQTQILGSVGYDGSGYNTFSPDMGSAGSAWIDRIAVLNNGDLLITYSEYFEDYSDPENPIWENHYYVAICNPDGKVKTKTDLAEYEVYYADNIYVLEDGRIFFNCYNTSLIFDESLNLIKKSTQEENSTDYYYGFYLLRDGRMVVSSWAEENIAYYIFDFENFKKGEKLELKADISSYSVMQGTDKYDFLLRNTSGIFGLNIGDEAVTPIMNLVNSDIDTTYFNFFSQIDDTTFIGSYNDWYEDDSQFKICKYTKVDPSDVKDKKVITLGCMYSDRDVRKKVIAFNKSSDDYRIVLTDYSIYNTEDDWEGGKKKFNTDIASGNAPDIIVSEGSLVHDYYSKGLFKDLTSYIKNDPDINYDDIFPNLIEACSYNGKLYEMVPSFSIQTVMARSSVVGNRTSWNFEEFNSFRKSLPEDVKLFNYMTRNDFLYYMMSVNSSEFIDMAKAQCQFTSDEFIEVLNLLKEFPESDDSYWETYDYMAENNAYREGKTVLYQSYISDFYDYRSARYGLFGDEITYIGLPCKEGTGSAIYYSTSYAISSKCKHADVAWEIIRPFFMEEYQKSVYSIPAMMSVFDAKAQDAKQRPYYMEDGVKVEYDDTYWIDGVDVVLEPLSDRDIEIIKNAILSTTKTQSFSEEINNIILEEAAPFFEGQKTAEDVAKIIQSRVTIYINEKQ